MKTLVTGAAGFLGSHVVRELLQGNGAEIRGMLAPGEPRDNLNGLDLEIVEGDVTDPASLRKAIKGCNRIYHLAAIYTVWTQDERLVYDVNVDGTYNLLSEARRAEVEKVVHTSSIAAVGIAEGKALSTEQTLFDKWEDKNIYVLTKFESERVAMRFAREGFPVTCVNPSFPFGTHDRRPTPTGALLLNAVKGKFPGYFDGGINVIDAGDVARGHLLAMEKGRPGERYLLAHRNLTIEEFFRLIADVAGVKFKRRKLPYSLMLGYAFVLEGIADLWTKKPPMATTRTVKYARNYLFYDNTKATTELGLAYTPVETSIQNAVEWWRKNGQI